MSSGVPRISRASNVPRPPHPISPTFSLSLAPKTLLADTAVHAVTPAPTDFLKKSRLSITPLSLARRNQPDSLLRVTGTCEYTSGLGARAGRSPRPQDM